MARIEARFWRRAAGFLPALGLLIALALPADLRANCALIPTAVRALTSTNGGLDRPFGAPGDTLTVLADEACKPGVQFPHFSPVAANNEVTLRFEPPNGGPITILPPFPASRVADCGTTRCFALEFEVPDTTNFGPLAGTGYSLTGPAEIEVRNTAAGGALVATVGELFEPTLACNPQNRYRSVFEQFTVLPPRNTYSPNASASLLATVDGSGAILIPVGYADVLASTTGGAATLRLLSVKADIANGLAAGNGLTGPDAQLLRIPRARGKGRFVRSYSFEGRPIPPLLEVTSPNALVDGLGVEYGDTLLGSVDFLDSVIRIAKKGPSPADPGTTLQLFALAGDAGAGPGAPALVNGAGPIVISDVELQASAAAPLNSLRKSDKVAVLARDEAVESRFPGLGDENGDPDSDDRVVEITSLANGGAIATNQAVTEAGIPAKAIIATSGARVAFLQSEAHQGRSDFTGDLSTMESVLRVWSADGSDPLCAGTPCELTSFLPGPVIADPAFELEAEGKTAPLAVSGTVVPDEFVFFATRERDVCPTAFGGAICTFTTGVSVPFSLNRVTTRLSQGAGGADTDGESRDIALSGDGLTAAYASDSSGLVPATPVVFETATYLIDVNAATGEATGTFVFDAGDADVQGLDWSGAGPGTVALFSAPVTPSQFQLWGSYTIDGGATLFAEVSSATPGILNISQPVPFTDATTGTFSATFSSFNTAGSLASPGSFGVTGLREVATADVVDGSVGPGGYQAAGTISFIGDAQANGDQIYAVTSSGIGSGDPQLVSASASGVAGVGDSSDPALSADGNVIAFVSGSSNLVPGNAAGGVEVFARADGTLIRVSEASPGIGGNGDSGNPAPSGDGRFIAYESDASNLVPGDTNGERDVFLYDRTFGTTERVSVDALGQLSGSSLAPSVSHDGRYVAFQSAGLDCSSECVAVRDRLTSTTELVSVGTSGDPPWDPSDVSSSPSISGDGRFVAFQSWAVNLLRDRLVLDGRVHCYLRDREKGVTQLVDTTLGGAPADAECHFPTITRDGRYVAFSSDATNLHPEEAAVQGLRAYLFDRVTGVAELVSPTGIELDSERVAIGDGEYRIVAYSSSYAVPVPNVLSMPADANGESDIYARVGLWAGIPPPPFDDSSLDGDGERSETVLRAYDGPTGTLVSSGVAVSSAVVGAGRALLTPSDPGANALVWQPRDGAPFDLGIQARAGAGQTALSADVACVIDSSGQLQVAQARGSVADPTGVQATRVKATSQEFAFDVCVYTDAAGVLGTASLGGFAQTLGLPAEDFQVTEDGIAFRSCESHPSLAQDKNGDGDLADCVMRFWRFQPTPPEAQLVETNRSAVPCTFPGCDPFFEPYRVQETILSFVTQEPDEVNSGATGQRGIGCLSTSPPAACDLTGDRDGDDVALEVYSLVSGRSQTFPLSKENPPQSAPFPTVKSGDDSVIVLELPAAVLGEAFASLPPQQGVTVIAGDADEDFTFDQDGIEEPSVSRGDNCAYVPNASQTDSDGDGLGAGCDVTLASQAPGQTVIENDDPVSAPAPAQTPGSFLCDLNKSGKIIRPEVDQVWADRGTQISQPTNKDLDPALEPSDDRDADADGTITASDFRLCLALCDGQSGGCKTAETGGSGGGFRRCGLLGIEALLALVPLAWRRRRRRAA